MFDRLPTLKVVWEIARRASGGGRELLHAARAQDANAVLFPVAASPETLGSWAEIVESNDTVIVGLDSDDLVARRNRALEERLALLKQARCAAVLLQNVETDSLKAGRPFHRLLQLRDAGLTQKIFLDAPSAAVAEWMVENTPAAAVAVPFDLWEQSAKFRLFQIAREMQTGLLSRRHVVRRISASASREDDLSFRIAESPVTALIEPLPDSTDEMLSILRCIASPMSGIHRDEWWERFAATVEAPPKPKRGHPPEYGA